MINPEKNREKKVTKEINISPEMEISLGLEDELREVQAKIKQPDLNEEQLRDLKIQEEHVLLQIINRAKRMFKEREKNKITDQKGMADQIGSYLKKEQNRDKQIDFFIGRLQPVFDTAKEFFSRDQVAEILKEVNKCRQIKDDPDLISELVRILEPVLEFQKNNPKILEEIERKQFGRDRENGEKFTAIEGTKGIFLYGGEKTERLHLHMAPARTENIIYIIGKLFPLAMSRLVEVIKEHPQIESVTATSYIVAAVPDLFTKKRSGFSKIEPMKKEWRLQYFGDCEMPVLKASMSREEFLKKWGSKK